MDELDDLMRNGNTYITYWNDGTPVRNCSDQSTFKSTYDAAEYCFEMSTDIDQMYYTPIATLYKAMESANPQKKGNDTIDLAALLRSNYRNELQSTNNYKNDVIMNEKNFDYLKDQVKYTGFGEGLEADLRQNMEQLQPEFSLKHDAFYGNDKVSAELNFKKSEQSEMYFFNSYKAELQKEGAKETLEQTFYINKGNNITLKEAYNLMEGRSVNKDLTNKEGEEYNAWSQLDFKNTDARGNFAVKHYHENYGFDLEAALSKHPIKELQNDSHKQDLMNSLKKGNRQSATFIKDGKEVKQYIEATPQFKTLTLYDAEQKRLDTRQAKEQEQSQGSSQSQKENKKQAASNEEDGPAGQQDKKQRRKSQSL
ncbi:hypothetical protein [Flavobacterium subsaxonicum]|nr:hypothetical protein [Flavobacterium subsaxonicum]